MNSIFSFLFLGSMVALPVVATSHNWGLSSEKNMTVISKMQCLPEQRDLSGKCPVSFRGVGGSYFGGGTAGGK